MQRFITIDLETQSNILFTAPGNLWLQLTTELFANASGTAAGAAITNYQRFTERQPVQVPTSGIDSTQTVSNIELYINNIFVNPEIHDIYIKRI